MPGGGSKPGERRGGRQRGTPNKTLTEQAQALAAKVAKAEARANAKLVALAHAIQATIAESRGLPGASARERFKELVLNALPCLIGMDACVCAHHLSCKLRMVGHDARLMPAKYVRPYSKGQKNDFRDAEAIAEAV